MMEKINDLIDEWVKGWMSYGMNELMDEWINKMMSKGMD